MKQLLTIALSILLLACSSPEKTETVDGKPGEIKAKPFTPLTNDSIEDGEVVVLLNNSLFSYMIYKGVTLGYEYELLKMFCEDNNLELKIKVVHDAAHILDSLKAGHGHMAAGNFTINSERVKSNNFSSPFFKTKQVLVQHLPENRLKMTLDNIKASLIQDPLDLDGNTITVQKNSVFYDRLNTFSSANAININVIPAESALTTEDLIELVDQGKIDYTVADQNISQFYSAFYSDLDFNTAISFNQNIAWAVNKKQDKLLQKINAWVKKNKDGLSFNMLNNKYFDMTKRNIRSVKKNWDVVKSGVISPYDDLIRKYAKIEDMDWLLLASLIYQESQFDPKSKSWVGAMGLTQVMPATAGDLGVNNPNRLYEPDVSIEVGSKYLKQLIDWWQPVLEDSVQANYFALASYNAGKGHVLDARRLAAKLGKNQNEWFGQVESAMLLKSNPKYFNDPVVKFGYCVGKEPVGYVNNIQGFYETFNTYTNEKVLNTTPNI